MLCCFDFNKNKDEDKPLISPNLNKKNVHNTSWISNLLFNKDNLNILHTKKATDNNSYCNNIFFSWLTPLLRLGNIRPLEFNDLYQLDNKNQASYISDKYEKIWNSFKKPNTFKTLSYGFGFPFFYAGILKLIHDGLNFISPFIIKSIVHFLMNPNESLNEGLLYVFIIFITGIIQSFCLRQYFYYCYLTGMRFRSAICTAVYKKSLKLSIYARTKKTTGEITNLISIDAQRLQDLTPYIHGLWFALFQIIISCYLLYKELGVACFSGVGIIIITIPITTGIGKCMRSLQKNLMKVKDNRIKICHEVLSGMKVIKLQAWETSFTDEVMEYRDEELKKLRIYNIAQAISSTIYNIIPSLVAIASFTTYILLGHSLEIGMALASVALFNILRFPLYMFPMVLNTAIEASVSLKRLDDFFKQEEKIIISQGDLTEIGIKIIKADIGWPIMDDHIINNEENKEKSKNNKKDTTKDTKIIKNNIILKDISLEIKKGQLIGIVGHVGSGKSTLLNSILGDTICLKGSIYKKGTIAYVSQQPFIQYATLRDNILFGLPYNKEKYENAIHVSALKPDLIVLPNGDMTEIGEKGINLSGGQKTRVSVARAVYQNADIYILDDPLSAVDSHVGRDIFINCILKELKEKNNKTILFVTNGLTFLPNCDEIIVLENGSIIEKGTYNIISKNQGVLSRLIATHKEGNTRNDNENDINNQLNDEIIQQDNDNNSNDSILMNNERKKSRSISSDSDKSIIVNNKITNLKKSDSNSNNNNNSLMTDEDRSIGDVEWKVYQVWINASGGIYMVFGLIILSILSQLLTVGSTVWLSYWSEDGMNSHHSQMFYLWVYIGLNFGFALFIFFRSIFLYFSALIASRRLFNTLILRVLRAPMTFFDTTPLGRIINRLSKDIYTVDEQIPGTMGMFLGTVVSVLSTVITIVYVTPYFSTVLVPIFIGYYISQRYFIKTSRELQRLDSISRSPVYALLGETLDGLSTIHAYCVETKFEIKNQEILNKNQQAYFLYFSANCWLALRLEFAGTLIAAGAALFAVLGHHSNHIDPILAGLAGVSLSYAFNVTQSLNWTVRMVSQLETQMISVERIKNYSEMPSEAKLYSNCPPPMYWPTLGAIEFKDVQLQYRTNLPMVLKGLTLSIKPMEKIGICGRTGAGKSSLVVALMRLVEINNGKITIDNINIQSIGLHELRSRISIIPQDPVLFSGTIRSNVDPFNKYTTEEILLSLKRVYLYDKINNNLNMIVEERGSNFSVGERQLLCIARALLRRSRIILMDEATASIDLNTDKYIQKTIRNEFKDCTCLTIAHRLNTIMDSDRVLVMDNGKVGEFDTPNKLLKKEDSMFKELVNHWEQQEN